MGALPHRGVLIERGQTVPETGLESGHNRAAPDGAALIALGVSTDEDHGPLDLTGAFHVSTG